MRPRTLRRRGFEPGPLLIRTDVVDPCRRPRRLSPQSLYAALFRLARQANVPRVSPHDLRRTYITQLLDAKADIGAVSGLAGHANVTTTMRYDRRGERARREAAQLLRAPESPTAAARRRRTSRTSKASASSRP